jgi:hypothetical protein
MQRTSFFHDRIRHPLFGVPQDIFHDTRALHARECMFHFDPDLCQLSVALLLSGREFASRRLFFRLAGLLDCWFVPLKARIFVQHRPRRISWVLLVGNLFLMRLPDVGLAQEADPFAACLDDAHVLVGMRFLLAAVVRGLFFGVFRPLPTPFRGIEDEPRLLLGEPGARANLTGVSLGQHAQVIESVSEDRQEPVNPKVRPLLTQTEEFAHEDLQGIRFQIDKDKQEFLFRAMQHAMAASPRTALAGVACKGLPRGKERLIGSGEGWQEPLELRNS